MAEVVATPETALATDTMGVGFSGSGFLVGSSSTTCAAAAMQTRKLGNKHPANRKDGIQGIFCTICSMAG